MNTTAEALTLNVYEVQRGEHVAQVGNLPDVTGAEWERIGQLRNIAEAEVLRAYPDARITGAATAGDHQYLIWFRF